MVDNLTDLLAAQGGGGAIAAEHMGKLSILDRLFENFELSEADAVYQREEEHHRIHKKLMENKATMAEDAVLLQRQFTTRMARKQFREAFPKLRRASTLRSLTLSPSGGGAL